MWRELLAAVNLVPWQGYGWLQVGAAELAVVDRYPPIHELWLQGHNIFVEFIVWCGWPLGLLLGVSLIYWFLSRALRVRTLEGAIGMLVVSFVGLHALFESPHHFLYFLIPVGLWAGIVEREQGRAVLGSGHGCCSAALAAVVFVSIAWDYPAMEDDFRLVRVQTARIGNVHASRPAPHAPMMSSLTGFLRFART